MPVVTVIITTFNRVQTLGRALESVLNQTYKNIDLLVVDDGSTDSTRQLLQGMKDPGIRVIYHMKNRGTTAARNTGLENIRGDWFTFLDSDDEMVPEALDTLLAVPRTVDPMINKVECNGVVFGTNQWTGLGLEHDQYLDAATAFTRMKEDFWGITRTDLLQGDCFNENLRGYENLLWSRIRNRAKEYYIHKPLLINHREGTDRISQPRAMGEVEAAKLYKHLLGERHWWDNLRTYRRDEYLRQAMKGLLLTLAAGDVAGGREYKSLLMALQGSRFTKALAGGVALLGPVGARGVYRVIQVVKRG